MDSAKTLSHDCRASVSRSAATPEQVAEVRAEFDDENLQMLADVYQAFRARIDLGAVMSWRIGQGEDVLLYPLFQAALVAISADMRLGEVMEMLSDRDKLAARVAELEAEHTAPTKYGRPGVDWAAGREQVDGALPRMLPEVEARRTVAHWRQTGHVPDAVLLRREHTAWHRWPLDSDEADTLNQEEGRAASTAAQGGEFDARSEALQWRDTNTLDEIDKHGGEQ